jgi:tRNA-5-methyluridine54 2-sulfurtransferase
MKCKLCASKASLIMPQHHLALCAQHYLEWVPAQTERFIKKYRMFGHDERILVAISGGKDSLALWDVLWRLGYSVDGLYIDLGIETELPYSTRSRQFAEAFAAERELKLHVVDVRARYGESISELSRRTHRGQQKPCAVCGISKRHVMNQAAVENGYPVLATGHNLDDEVAVLFGNTLEWKVEAMSRQAPVLQENHGLPRKVKPFCRFYERETAAYALLRGIDYIYDECPFALGNQTNAYKQTLNQMEADRPGTKLTFYLNFLNARQAGNFLENTTGTPIQIHACPTCGQPTTNSDDCAFCKMVQKNASEKTIDR